MKEPRVPIMETLNVDLQAIRVPYMSDEHYTRELEGNGAATEEVIDALIKSGIEIHGERDQFFLIDMQNVHDHCPPTDWGAKLQNVAERWQLTFPEGV